MMTARRTLAATLLIAALALSACTAAGSAQSREIDSSTAGPASAGLSRQVPVSGDAALDPDAPVQSPAAGTAPGGSPVAPVPEPILWDNPGSEPGGNASSAPSTGAGGGVSGYSGGASGSYPGTGAVADPGAVEPAPVVAPEPSLGPSGSVNFSDVQARLLDERTLLVSGSARVWEGVFTVEVRVDGQVRASRQVTVAEGAPAFSPFEVEIALEEPLGDGGAEIWFLTQSPRDGSDQVEFVTKAAREQ